MSIRARNPRSFTAIAAASTIDDDGRQWIEVMPTADKARNGRFYFSVTRDDLETYAESIRANASKTPVDYDHDGANDGGSTRAAGWFTGQARVTDDPDRGPILEAEVKWTPKARQEIEDGEFRFVSAEFSFEDKDEKTGLMTKAKDIAAATLTNRPFFSQLAALAADDGSVLWDAEQGVNDLQSRLAEALNPGTRTYDQTRFWVLDVDVAGRRALVCAAYPDDDTWIVPYELDADGAVTVPASVDWIRVEQAWVADTDSDDPAYASVAMLARAARAARDGFALAAKWTASYVNDLPDSAFLYVKPGGTKDDDSKTVPRSNRMFPFKNANGDVDLPHLRNALARIPQSDLDDQTKERLTNKATQLLKDNGGDDSATTKEEHVSDELKALAADLGLPEDATVEQITEAVKTAKAHGDRVEELEAELAVARASAGGGDKVVTIDKEQLEQLRRDAEQGVTARQTQLQMEADTLVTAAVKDGRIAPASRDDWRKAILPDGAAALVETEAAALASLAKGRVPVKERATASDQNGNALTGDPTTYDAVRASLGLKPVATAIGKDN